MKFNKGFTLIELLVVIAIIGILSSVVLASLTSARSKGSDAAIVNELSNMRAQAELYYSSSGANSYGPALGATSCPTTAADTNIFSTTTTGGLFPLISSVDAKSTSVICTVGTNGTSWAVTASTSGTNNSWCVDSTGTSEAGGLGSANACD